MTNNEKLLSIELLSRIVRLNDAQDGLVWLPRSEEEHGTRGDFHRWNSRFSGKPALLSVSQDGYLRGRIHWRYYLAHRVIWALSHARWPDGLVDHVNGDRRDNRPGNLREASRVENARNSKRSIRNTTGRTGVTRHARRSGFIAQIGVSGKRIYLGTFDDFDDACAARSAAEIKFGFHANHGRFDNTAASHRYFDRI